MATRKGSANEQSVMENTEHALTIAGWLENDLGMQDVRQLLVHFIGDMPMEILYRGQMSIPSYNMKKPRLLSLGFL